MINYQYIPHIVTGIFVLLSLILIIYLIRSVLRQKEEDRKFDKQLNYNLNPQIEEKEDTSFITASLRILPEKLIESGMVSEEMGIAKLQSRLTLIFALVFTLTMIFTRNIIAGLVPVIFVYIALSVLSMLKINKTKGLIDDQIPAFVANFKANIQANQHAQNAMIRAINNTADPLYSELSYGKAIMEAGDFKAGIVAIRKSAENETLRQMASCIELASTSGSNIEGQIEIIEDIIQDKQKIERKKKLGVNENKPLFIISGLFIPISFIGSYFMSDMHRDYWFQSTTSWIVLIGILIAMGISMFATWKVIQKVEIN